VANYKQLEENLFIGPQPTTQDLNEAKQGGVRTVIDLRMPSETAVPNADMVRNSGLDYVNIPVDKTALFSGQIDALDAALKENEGPYLVHCATGTRAAMLLALSRAKQNRWTTERTFLEAEAMGYDLKNSPDFADFVQKTLGK